MVSQVAHKSRQEVIYTPESRVRHPIQMLKEMLTDLFLSRELAWRLLSRDIRSQYRSSFLGIFWAIIPPLLTAVGLTFAQSTGLVNVDKTDIPYPAYVMLGTILWQTFLESLNSPQRAINTSRPLLAQVKFPHEAIILAQLGQVLFNLSIKLALLVALFLLFKVSISWTIIFAPIAFILLMLLGLSIGLWLVPLVNLVQDVSRSMEVITLVWFFLTPIVYPTPTRGILSILVKINPVSPLVVTTRELITTGNLSQFPLFLIMSALVLVGLVLGWTIYRLSIPFLIERIS